MTLLDTKAQTGLNYDPLNEEHLVIPRHLQDIYKEANVSRETQGDLIQYYNLLMKWQKAKNIIAPSTIPDALERHFLDSAQLLSFLELPQTSTLLDIGSGGGFPGLVLSLLTEGKVKCHLVESNKKKASFLKTVVRATKSNAEIYDIRIEDLCPFKADFITARACASIDHLLHWSSNFITDKTTCLFLKGESVNLELTEAVKKWNMDIEKRKSITAEKGTVLIIKNISRK